MQNIPHWQQLSEVPEDPHKNFPAVSLDLIEELERCFPDRCPTLDASDREIWAAVGKAQVVRFLRDMFNRRQP